MTSFTLVLWGFCALFVMAWVFVIGVFVGRGFLPGADSALMDLKAQITKLQDMTAKNRRSEPEPQRKENIDEMLAFYERLESKKDEAKKKDPISAIARGGSKNASSEKPETENPKHEISAKAENPKSGSVADPASGSGLYTLQVASLEEKGKAEAVVKRLASRGYDAYLNEARLKGKTYFRVRCGRFATRDEAGDYAAKLFRDLKIRGFVSKIE